MEFSFATNIGKREKNQDCFGIENDCACVADGHGEFGEQTALNITLQLLGAPLQDPPHEEILKLFKKLDESNKEEWGSTVSAAWIKGGDIWIAQLGDSPIFWEDNGKMFHLAGHNVAYYDNPDVVALYKRGAQFYIEHKYLASPDGIHLLQLSRSIGDSKFGDFVSKVPEIFKIHAQKLLICSDGYTGTKENVKKLFDSNPKASDFIEEQKTRGISDNITCIYGRL